MVKVRRSRRAASLQPGDYDHEIILIDDDNDATLRQVFSPEDNVLATTSTSTHLLSDDEGEEVEADSASEDDNLGQVGQAVTQQRDGEQDQEDDSVSVRRNIPKIQTVIQVASTSAVEPESRPRTPDSLPGVTINEIVTVSRDESHFKQNGNSYVIMPKRRKKEKRETAVDILYENERGLFLCGMALFSGAALGGLDPTGWTNAYHHPSPTNIHTAQVPDPTWEWIWPEWKLYHEDGRDEGGWQYSFHFSKKFSWHKGKWYNSFVRRRAWIRRRAKKRLEDVSQDPHMFNPSDYFSVVAASERDPRSPLSMSGSVAASFTRGSTVHPEEKPDIEDMETLLHVLRAARIDREKREAVENYLEHAIDLSCLQHEMHEIMSLFVFQASRRQLLSIFLQKHDEAIDALEKDDTLELKLHKDALDAAVRHAEEEVTRLAYWSDVKQMAENGELTYQEEAFFDTWQGLDKSAPAPPSNGKLPKKM